MAATKLKMTGMEEKLAGNDHYSRQADLRRASRSTDRESQGPRFDKTTDVTDLYRIQIRRSFTSD